MKDLVIVLLLLSGAVITGLSILALHRRASTLVRLFGLSMVCAAIWNFGFAAEILSPTLEEKVFWANIQFLGIAFLPVVWLGMSLTAVGHSRNLLRLTTAALAIPVLTILLAWTDPMHHLFRGSPALITAGPFPVLDSDYAVFFYAVHAPFGYALFAVSLFVLARGLAKAPGVYRRQLVSLVVAVVLPLAVDVLYVLGINPIEGFNFASITFSLSGIILGLNILRNQFLDLLPLAYDAAVQEMRVGVIVLDDSRRIIHLNPAAEQATGISSDSSVSQELCKVLPELSACLDRDEGQEVSFQRAGESFTYELQRADIYDARKRNIGQVLTLHDVTERSVLLEEVERLSITDPLTDAFNRRALNRFGEQEIQRAYRYHRDLSLVLLDVDNFKEINDHYGHQYGDSILKAIVSSIYRSVRTTDQVFRYGGDEFVVLMIETDAEAALQTAERIREGLLSIPVGTDSDGPQEVKISMGVTGLTSNDTPERMLQRADRGLYAAKEAGKDRVVLA